MIVNKEIMARNIKRLMEKKNVNATEICKILEIKQNTFSDWVNAKTYPRIDKIEAMANYFGVRKSELVEEPSVEITLDNDEKVIIELYRNEPEFRQLLRLSKYYDLIKKGGKDEN